MDDFLSACRYKLPCFVCRKYTPLSDIIQVFFKNSIIFFFFAGKEYLERVCLFFQLEGNEVQLKQLVSILLDNAIRHNQPNGTVEVLLKREKRHAVLCVSNEGEPIPEQQRERLFERFYQTDSARAHSGHYGFGLAIAKAIVTAHKGTIAVRCPAGRIEFCVRFLLKR